MKNRLVAISVLAAMALPMPALMITGAHAADLDAEIAQEAGVTPVEYGSGWYLRGDVGIFHGTGNTSYPNGGTASLNGVDFFQEASWQAGIGYVFNDMFRADVTIANHSGFDHYGFSDAAPCEAPYTGDCLYEESANLSATSFQANGYVNLGQHGAFKPYLGGGLGLTRVTWNNYSGREYCELDPGEDCATASHSGGPGVEVYAQDPATSGRGETLMMNYSLMAGLDYKLDNNWIVDLGYKFTQFRDIGLNSVDRLGTLDSTSIHEIKVGLRYEIW